jgi:hypothetical protein
MGEQTRRGVALRDWLWRQRRDCHRRAVILHSFAGRAGIFEPDMLQHLDLRRNNIELFRYGFADTALTAAASADFFVLGNIVLDTRARNMIG